MNFFTRDKALMKRRLLSLVVLFLFYLMLDDAPVQRTVIYIGLTIAFQVISWLYITYIKKDHA